MHRRVNILQYVRTPFGRWQRLRFYSSPWYISPGRVTPEIPLISHG